MSNRYDHIRNIASNPSTSFTVVYYLKEDLSQFGGPVTVLREFRKNYGLGADPFKVADDLEAFCTRAKANIDALAAEFGFKSIISVE